MVKAPGGVGLTTAPRGFCVCQKFSPLVSALALFAEKFLFLLCQENFPFGKPRPLKNVAPSTETFWDERMSIVHVLNGRFLWSPLFCLLV